MMAILLAGVLGYLLGSVPTGVLVCRVMRGVDLREQGSGHTGGLNTFRTAGLGAGILTGVVDLLLGAGAVTGAALLTDDPWAATAAGVMAVVGHNWSIFIRFGGGIGLSSLAGALSYRSPLVTLETMVILLAFWLILVGLVRVHRARATIIAMVVAGPLFWALTGFDAALPDILLAVLGGVVIIVKTIPDWNRQYG
jgi:glycerol-3-phosphate acyltransferase PlsY